MILYKYNISSPENTLLCICKKILNQNNENIDLSERYFLKLKKEFINKKLFTGFKLLSRKIFF